MSVKKPSVPLSKGIYKPLNEPTTPWLAGILEMPATNSFKTYNIPVFYVGNNNNTFFGAYNGKESFFNQELKKLILELPNGKKDDCVKLGDVCVNGIPLFIRQNKSGEEYLSKDDDVISLVVKRNGAKDGDYTIENLTVDETDIKIRVIPMIHKALVKKNHPVHEYEPIVSITTKINEKMETIELEYPYYHESYTQNGYSQLQERLRDSCPKVKNNNLCDMFKKRYEIIYKEQLASEKLATQRLQTEANLSHKYLTYKNEQAKARGVFLGGTRHKKKIHRTKRAKRTKRTRRH
jgi:hypothetical protein